MNSDDSIPNLAEIFRPALERVALEQRPLLIALAERLAADRYREWANAAGAESVDHERDVQVRRLRSDRPPCTAERPSNCDSIRSHVSSRSPVSSPTQRASRTTRLTIETVRSPKTLRLNAFAASRNAADPRATGYKRGLRLAV